MKSNKIEITHNQAMDIAEKAFIQLNNGNEEIAKSLFHQAYLLEKEAAFSLMKNTSDALAKTILLKSAASLAHNCDNFFDSREHIKQALNCNPPENLEHELNEMLAEMNESLKTISFRRKKAVSG